MIRCVAVLPRYQREVSIRLLWHRSCLSGVGVTGLDADRLFRNRTIPSLGAEASVADGSQPRRYDQV